MANPDMFKVTADDGSAIYLDTSKIVAIMKPNQFAMRPAGPNQAIQAMVFFNAQFNVGIPMSEAEKLLKFMGWEE